MTTQFIGASCSGNWVDINVSALPSGTAYVRYKVTCYGGGGFANPPATAPLPDGTVRISTALAGLGGTDCSLTVEAYNSVLLLPSNIIRSTTDTFDCAAPATGTAQLVGICGQTGCTGACCNCVPDGSAASSNGSLSSAASSLASARSSATSSVVSSLACPATCPLTPASQCIAGGGTILPAALSIVQQSTHRNWWSRFLSFLPGFSAPSLPPLTAQLSLSSLQEVCTLECSLPNILDAELCRCFLPSFSSASTQRSSANTSDDPAICCCLGSVSSAASSAHSSRSPNCDTRCTALACSQCQQNGNGCFVNTNTPVSGYECAPKGMVISGMAECGCGGSRGSGGSNSSLSSANSSRSDGCIVVPTPQCPADFSLSGPVISVVPTPTENRWNHFSGWLFARLLPPDPPTAQIIGACSFNTITGLRDPCMPAGYCTALATVAGVCSDRANGVTSGLCCSLSNCIGAEFCSDSPSACTAAGGTAVGRNCLADTSGITASPMAPFQSSYLGACCLMTSSSTSNTISSNRSSAAFISSPITQPSSNDSSNRSSDGFLRCTEGACTVGLLGTTCATTTPDCWRTEPNGSLTTGQLANVGTCGNANCNGSCVLCTFASTSSIPSLSSAQQSSQGPFLCCRNASSTSSRNSNGSGRSGGSGGSNASAQASDDVCVPSCARTRGTGDPHFSMEDGNGRVVAFFDDNVRQAAGKKTLLFSSGEAEVWYATAVFPPVGGTVIHHIWWSHPARGELHEFSIINDQWLHNGQVMTTDFLQRTTLPNGGAYFVNVTRHEYMENGVVYRYFALIADLDPGADCTGRSLVTELGGLMSVLYRRLQRDSPLIGPESIAIGPDADGWSWVGAPFGITRSMFEFPITIDHTFRTIPRTFWERVVCSNDFIPANPRWTSWDPLVPRTCFGDECTKGGDAFCGSTQRCDTIDTLPCIVCRPFGNSSRSSSPYRCMGDECLLGGTSYCAGFQKDCYTIGAQPCLVCVSDPSSYHAYNSAISLRSSASFMSRSRSSSTIFRPNVDWCAGNECALGGDTFCNTMGLACGPIPDQPCIVCTDQTTADQLYASFVPRPTLLPAALALVTSSCTLHDECTGGRQCVEGHCLTEQQIDSLPSFCGNARLDLGERCDTGYENSDLPNALCRRDCTEGRCGDGIVDTPLERCDDGNVNNGDGCSALCITEHTAADSTLIGSLLDIPFLPGQNSSTGEGTGITPLPPATANTGPAAIAIMAAGAAAGWAWVRRKRRL